MDSGANMRPIFKALLDTTLVFVLGVFGGAYIFRKVTNDQMSWSDSYDIAVTMCWICFPLMFLAFWRMHHMEKNRLDKLKS